MGSGQGHLLAQLLCCSHHTGIESWAPPRCLPHPPRLPTLQVRSQRVVRRQLEVCLGLDYDAALPPEALCGGAQALLDVVTLATRGCRGVQQGYIPGNA